MIDFVPVCFKAARIASMTRMRALFPLIALAGLFFAAETSRAAEVSIPDVPSSVYFDTESITNAPVSRRLMERTRIVSGEISLFATPSNCVEVFFSTVGTNSESGAPVSFGWDCGTWFLSSPTNRLEGEIHENADVRSLSFRLRVSDQGDPVSFEVSTSDGESPFPGIREELPEWLFSRKWDNVRVAVRGVDERTERVSVFLDHDPWVLILR